MGTHKINFLPRAAIGMRRAMLGCIGVVALGFLAGQTCVHAQSPQASAQKYPDVIAVKVQARSGQVFDFDVTVSSPYDSPRRYADAFRVAGKDGKIYGERKLLHDHAGEQPFTRDLYGVSIPRGVRSVLAQARDQQYGYGGKSVEAALPGR
ncbi:MAG: hypothetical protein IH605_06670 [Burkholderiales bacterium]|nr:hypothetical protein [Burkholderiales bacterium]